MQFRPFAPNLLSLIHLRNFYVTFPPHQVSNFTSLFILRSSSFLLLPSLPNCLYSRLPRKNIHFATSDSAYRFSCYCVSPIIPFSLFSTNFTLTSSFLAGFSPLSLRHTIKYLSLRPQTRPLLFSTRISAVSPTNCCR